MAYRHFFGAPFLSCWSDGENVCVREVTGSVSRFPCKLNFKTEEQINPFISKYANWVLFHEDVIYVGRDESTFSGFRMKDGLLVRYGVWGLNRSSEFRFVGRMANRDAVIDSRDKRTVYIRHRDLVYRLHEPLREYPNMYQLALVQELQSPELLIPVGGEYLNVEKAGVWLPTPILPRGSNPVQL